MSIFQDPLRSVFRAFNWVGLAGLAVLARDPQPASDVVPCDGGGRGPSTLPTQGLQRSSSMLFISLSNKRHINAPCDTSRKAHKAHIPVQRTSTEYRGMCAPHTDQACTHARTGPASAHAGTDRQCLSLVPAQTPRCLHVMSVRNARVVPSTQDVDRIAGHCQHAPKNR